MSRSISRRAAILVFVLTSASIFGLAQAEGSDKKTKEVKGTVIGKVEVKSERDRGEVLEVVYVEVFLAQDDSRKSLDKLLGSKLKVVGPKSDNIAEFSGEVVQIAGKILGSKEILVDTVTMKKADVGGSESKTASKKKSRSSGEGSDKK